MKIQIDWSNGCPRLQWFSTLEGRESPSDMPFLADCRTRAYTFDAMTGGVLHYVGKMFYILCEHYSRARSWDASG